MSSKWQWPHCQQTPILEDGQLLVQLTEGAWIPVVAIESDVPLHALMLALREDGSADQIYPSFPERGASDQ